MQTYKDKPYNSYQLSSSSVYQTRTKASSLYQKRPTFDVPQLQIGNTQLNTKNYDNPSNNRKQEGVSRLAISQAVEGDSWGATRKYDSTSKNRTSNYFTENKSATRFAPATDRIMVKENDSFNFKAESKKVQVPKYSQFVNSNENSDDYARIRERLNKKEKIIQQLQKLCDNKVSDKIRSSQAYQKGTYQVYSPVRVKRGPPINKSANLLSEKEPEIFLTPPTFKIEMTQSLNFDQTTSPAISSLLTPPEEKINMRKNSDVQLNSKNPEDSLYVKRLNSAYLTPKQPKASFDFQYKRENPRKDVERSYKMFDSLGVTDLTKNDELTSPSIKVVSETATAKKVYSPIQRKKDREDSSHEQKYSRDVRQIKEIKSLKKSQVFSNKKVSVHDFVLKKSLGEGKFGIVYQAFHKDTGSLFALKKISKSVIKSNLMVDQLLQEIKIQNFCNNENILKVFGFFDDSEHIYLILQYMQEGTLFTHLKQQKALTEEDAKDKLTDISKAVIYMHQQGIAHRDIKPENIVMSCGVSKLCDFGWAAICTDRRKTYCGTFDYVAPQILEGSQYDASVDLWCLGVLAYELLVGKAPFYHISRKQTMKKIMKVQKLEYPPNLSPKAISFIQNLIKKNPEERMNGQSILRHPFLTKSRHST